jgi:two-component system heavy metal sensor histidine kinase CusS
MAKLPLRGKLTLWFVTLFGVIYLGLITVVWFIGRNSHDRLLDEALMSVARSVGGLLIDIESDFSNLDLGPYQPVDREFVLLAVRDGNGAVVASDLRVDTSALPPLPPLDQETTIHRISGQTARSLVGRVIQSRLVTHRVVSRDGAVCYIDLARATEFGLLQRRLFTDVLLTAGLVGLISSAVAAWFLVGTATTPIERLAEVARLVGPESDTRFPAGSSGREIERLQTELNEALGRLEQGYRVRQSFLANVAHDLKTPISVMLAQSQVLEAERASLPEFRQYRQSMIEELRRLRGIIEGTLALSRANQGEALLRRTKLPVNTLLAQSALRCKAQADAARVRLKMSMLGPEEGGELFGDVDLLSTMLDNLIRNAIRFSPPRETVNVEAELAGGQVRLAVRDHGPGIPEEYLGRIFDRFVQVPLESGQVKGGTGLGLAIAKTVAEVHGGTISVRSRRRGGCAFTVSLPLSAAGTSEAHSAASGRV